MRGKVRSSLLGRGAVVVNHVECCLDPATGRFLLPVDALRVDLEQHVDAAAAHSATWVAGTPALTHSDTAG